MNHPGREHRFCQPILNRPPPVGVGPHQPCAPRRRRRDLRAERIEHPARSIEPEVIHRSSQVPADLPGTGAKLDQEVVASGGQSSRARPAPPHGPHPLECPHGHRTWGLGRRTARPSCSATLPRRRTLARQARSSRVYPTSGLVHLVEQSMVWRCRQPVRRSAVGGVAGDLAEVEDEHAAASATRTPRQSCGTPISTTPRPTRRSAPGAAGRPPSAQPVDLPRIRMVSVPGRRWTGPGHPRIPGPVSLVPLPAQQVADPAPGHLHDGR